MSDDRHARLPEPLEIFRDALGAHFVGDFIVRQDLGSILRPFDKEVLRRLNRARQGTGNDAVQVQFPLVEHRSQAARLLVAQVGKRPFLVFVAWRAASNGVGMPDQI